MHIVYVVDSAGRQLYYKLGARGKKTRISKTKLSDYQLDSAELFTKGESRITSKSTSRRGRSNKRSTSRRRKNSTKRSKSPIKHKSPVKTAEAIIQEIIENTTETTVEEIEVLERGRQSSRNSEGYSVEQLSEQEINEVTSEIAVVEAEKVLEAQSTSRLRELARKYNIKGYATMARERLLDVLITLLLPAIIFTVDDYVYGWIADYYGYVL